MRRRCRLCRRNCVCRNGRRTLRRTRGCQSGGKAHQPPGRGLTNCTIGRVPAAAHNQLYIMNNSETKSDNANKVQSKKTVVVGATPNPSRYAYLAANMLRDYKHEVVPVGIKQ